MRKGLQFVFARFGKTKRIHIAQLRFDGTVIESAKALCGMRATYVQFDRRDVDLANLCEKCSGSVSDKELAEMQQ